MCQAMGVCVQIYMEPLVERLGVSQPLHVEVMPLLDTLIHLALALGGNVDRYALPLLQHSLATARANLAVAEADAAASAPSSAATPPSPGRPSSSSAASPLTAASSAGSPRPGEGALYAHSIVTYSLDLVAALLEVLKGSSDALLEAVGPEAVPALALACARVPKSPYVKQSAFALIGEIANQVPALAARWHGAEMLQLCHEMISPEQLSEVRLPSYACMCGGRGCAPGVPGLLLRRRRRCCSGVRAHAVCAAWFCESF